MKWIYVCLLFLSCAIGNRNESQAMEETALDCNVQDKKPAKADLCMELSQTHFVDVPQSVMLTITNNSQWSCIFGYEYFIEKKKESWEKVPLKNAAFLEIGLGIRPRTTRKLKIDLRNVCQKYTKGIYRVGKKIRIETMDGYRDTICYCLFKVL